MECAYAYAGTYEGEKQLPAGKLKRNKGRSETQMDKRADSCMKCKKMVTYIICLRTETESDVRLRMEIRYFTRRRMKNGTFHESGVDQKYIYWYSNVCTHMLSVFTILFSECLREIIRSKRSQGNTVGIIVLDRRRCAHETADQPGDTVLVSCVIDGTFYDPDTDI